MALLKDKRNRKLITQHESLGYFTRSFELEIVDYIQTQPGVPVEGKQLAKLVELCRRDGIRVIAVEPQYSRGNADTIREELKRKDVDVAIIELDPAETADANQLDAGFYERVMRANLETLAKHLQ